MHTPKTLNQYKNSVTEIVTLAEVDKKSGELASRAYPVRCQLPCYRGVNTSMFGLHYDAFDSLLKAGNQNGREIVGYVTTTPHVQHDIAKNLTSNIDFVHLWGIQRRFELTKGAIFTLTSPLIDRLLDLNKPSATIPASYLAPPFSNVFLEFGAAENRHESRIKASFEGKNDAIVEGVYVSEFDGNPNFNTHKMLEHFGLDSKSKYRILEVALSFSPLSFIDDKRFVDGMITPLMTYFMLCIPEDMSLNECVELNCSWLKSHTDTLESILPLVYNALLYIGLKNRVQQKVVALNKSNTLAKGNVKPFKAHKKAVAESTKYNSIRIGSTSKYLPVGDIIKDKQLPKGSKAPHPRRGYFAIRHVKVEGAKDLVPEIRRVKTTIVNKDLLTNDEIELLTKTYEVM